METKTRSLLKTILWRIVAIINVFVVSIIFLQNLSQSLFVAIVSNVVGMVLYYYYERIWNTVKWGRG